MTRSSAVVADSPPLPPLNCETCEFVMGVYVEIAGNATTLAEFVQLFSDACHVIAPGLPVLQDLCDGVIKAIVDGIVPFLDDQLTTLAWDIPATFCSTFIPVCTVPCCSDPTAPEQLRLALTNGGASEMSITWTALNLSAESSVQWGPAPGAAGALPNAAPAVARAFTLGGWLGVFYSATMTGLPHGARIAYRVGSDAGGWSSVREFSTLPDSAGTAARPLVLVHIGDQGWGDKSNTTIARVGALVASGAVDGVIHTGDVSYADGQEHSWDVYMRKIESIMSAVPYMVTPGNHEQVWWGGAPYRARWTVPSAFNASSGAPLTVVNRSFYAVDIGGVHMSMLDTESPFDVSDIPAQEAAWMRTDLTVARAASASKWIVAGGHRPFYCTNGGFGSSNKDCGPLATNLRNQAEAILGAARVDLVLGAHMHGYERTLPVADGKVVSGGSYASPAAPVYVVNGAGGNREGNDDPKGNAPWSAPSGLPPALTHTATIGYGVMTFIGGEPAGDNSLRYQFFESDSGTLLDDFTITK